MIACLLPDRLSPTASETKEGTRNVLLTSTFDKCFPNPKNLKGTKPDLPSEQKGCVLK